MACRLIPRNICSDACHSETLIQLKARVSNGQIPDGNAYIAALHNADRLVVIKWLASLGVEPPGDIWHCSAGLPDSVEIMQTIRTAFPHTDLVVVGRVASGSRDMKLLRAVVAITGWRQDYDPSSRMLLRPSTRLMLSMYTAPPR